MRGCLIRPGTTTPAPGRRRGFMPRDIGGCVLWLRADFGMTLGTTPLASGTTPPAITLSGTLTLNIGLRVEIQTTGARGSSTFRYSADNGTTWIEQSKTTAATYSMIGAASGMVLNFPAGTYTNDNVYKGTLSNWADKSGLGNDASQATAAVQPQYTFASANANSKPTVVMTNAANERFTIANALTAASSDYTVFITHYAAAAAANLRYFISNAGTSVVIAQLSNTVANTGYFDGAWREAAAATGLQVQTWILNNGAGALRRNGTTLASSLAYTQGALGANTTIGKAAVNPDTEIGEIVIYSRMLSSPEYSRVEKYMGGHFGVTIS